MQLFTLDPFGGGLPQPTGPNLNAGSGRSDAGLSGSCDDGAMAAKAGRQSDPRRRVEALAADVGPGVVVRGCMDLLAGNEVDGSVIFALGGPPARWAIDGGASGPDYWLRVWALRGLLWVWADEATSAVRSAMGDRSWRVREMAAKVSARHLLDDALPTLVKLREDPVPRVRAAAQRAVMSLTENAS
jgi:hypothetical protein